MGDHVHFHLLTRVEWGIRWYASRSDPKLFTRSESTEFVHILKANRKGPHTRPAPSLLSTKLLSVVDSVLFLMFRSVFSGTLISSRFSIVFSSEFGGRVPRKSRECGMAESGLNPTDLDTRITAPWKNEESDDMLAGLIQSCPPGPSHRVCPFLVFLRSFPLVNKGSFHYAVDTRVWLRLWPLGLAFFGEVTQRASRPGDQSWATENRL